MSEIICISPIDGTRLEGWIMQEVDKGAALPGLYPPNDESKARYEASRRRGSK